MNKNTVDLIGLLSMALSDKQTECDLLRADLEAYKSAAERNDTPTNDKVVSLEQQLNLIHNMMKSPTNLYMLTSYLAYDGCFEYETVGGKVKVVKRVHDLTGWGIIESKEFVEAHFGKVAQGSTPEPPKKEVVIKRAKCIDINGTTVLCKGKVYDVLDMDSYGGYRVAGSGVYWHPSRFEDVASEAHISQEPTIKKVRCIDNDGQHHTLNINEVYDVLRTMGATYNLRGVGGSNCWWDCSRFVDVSDEARTIKKVRCIYPSFAEKYLEDDKVYEVIECDSTEYTLRGIFGTWHKSRFVDVEA